MGERVSRRRWVRVCALLTLLLAGADSPALAQDGHQPSDGLLFSVSFENGLIAERAQGDADPIFASGAAVAPTGLHGSAVTTGESTALAWGAPGNIYAQRGLVAFSWRPREPLTTTPFPLFRVGYPDHSSWDMVFLRIDWNGSGFDAFVTDTNLSRTRVSFKAPSLPDAKAWTHIAFGWDEQTGVRLWIDGKPAARSDRKATYDSALFGFGPFQRVLNGMQVHSANNFIRGGDIDELKIYDHLLDDAAVAQLAKGERASTSAAPPRSLSDPAARTAWARRFGWDAAIPPPYLDAASTRIRKVEFTDTRDQKQKLFRGADGIRETTWPGVYNRSRLLGRNDYFQLPDWNVYSTSGKTYRLTLPDEAWNRIEITGAADGALDYTVQGKDETLLRRAPGVLRTTTALDGVRKGGLLTFTNTGQESPIQEIAAYNVTAGSAPAGLATLSYTIRASAQANYPILKELNAYIARRFVADERSVAVALPQGAPTTPMAGARAPGLPLVHVLIPASFRDSVRGRGPNRFTYGWQNMNAGLDGLAIDLPAMKVSAGVGGLIALNIRVKDPTWPDRDLIDVNVSVKPGEARNLWLDTRDRILPQDANLYLQIASASQDFDAAALDGAAIRLVFKSAADARAEHLADRFEQARDNFAFNVEERPGTRLYPTWARFEKDMTDVLSVDPDNAVARSYWVESNAEQPYAPLPELTVSAGVPRWAFLQTEDMKLYRQFIDWWIDERQIDNGEFGGGLSDDTDLVNMWVPLALMGVETDKLTKSQRRLLDATYANEMWTGGLSRIYGDELHSYEEGVNSVAQSMLMSWGDPTAIERAMEVARNYPRLAKVNAAGHTHFVSSYYSGADIVRDGVWGWQQQYSFLITHPGLLLVDYNGSPQVKAVILALADSWLAHGRQAADGSWSFPADIEWSTDKTRGSGVGSAAHVFWTAWRWTGDDKYLRPLTGDVSGAGVPGGLSALNADVIAWMGRNASWGASLAARGTRGGGRITNTSAGEGGFPAFVRWQETGDDKILEDIFAGEIESSRQRMHIVTEGHLWSDRVSLPIDTVQRSRMGGIAHRRNGYAPGNIVSWKFDTPRAAESVGILIRHGDPARFRVTLHNLSASPIRATMVGGDLKPGRWSVVAVADDGSPISGTRREVTFERGAEIPFDLPQGRTVTYALSLESPGAPVSDRPDIGISRDDLKVSGRTLTVKVHSLGARPLPRGRLVLEDSEGRELSSAATPALAAPLDLAPKTANVTLRLPSAPLGKGWRIELRLGGAPAEITLANNRADLD